MPLQQQQPSLHTEINDLTATEESSRQFLTSRNVLRQNVDCSSCNSPMVMVACAASKSADLYIWKCRSCKKCKGIRTDSILAGSNLSFKSFLTMIFYFAFKSLTNVEVAAVTGISDKTVVDFRTTVANGVADWFLRNCTPLGGPGKIVEIDEAKFGKRKFNKGAYSTVGHKAILGQNFIS